MKFILWAAVLLSFSQHATADLVPLGAQWKYLDDGSAYQSGWQSPGFDDSSWQTGSGQFGYGDGDEETIVSFGPAADSKHITTFFRHQFTVLSIPSEPLTLRVRRDDGVIVYLNGTEIFRDNMPDGEIGAETLAPTAVHGSDEHSLTSAAVNSELLLSGPNTLAVEIHQSNRSSNDISFDLQLTDSLVVRGPYLQQSFDTGMTVRWRTAIDRDAVLRYGTDPASLDQVAGDPTTSTEHEITLTGLIPDTRYYYAIGDSNEDYASSDNHYFDTHPESGSAAATRIWVLGDSGTADAKAATVRNAYTRFNGGGTHSDVLLMLGDNAYKDGTDVEYQAAVFDMYPEALRNSVLWPTLGNHDAHSADSGTQSGAYYDIFTLPTRGESGGVASGTEAYYSFDYGNIHFISLDSHDTDRSANGAMATWLENDLAATTQEWIIAFWHHPPYSRGSHDSDLEQRLVDMRTNFLPILELHGVDLVLGGHSHSYERSMLVNGHYGNSSTFDSAYILDSGDGDPAGDGPYTKSADSNTGTVYSVAGSSGKISAAPLDHPVMVTNLVELGSMVIDIQENQLDAVFLNGDSTVRDSFQIVHQPVATAALEAPDELSATASSPNEVHLQWSDNASDEENIVVQRSTDRLSWTDVATLVASANNFTDSGLQENTGYYYRVLAKNSQVDSSPSNTVSVNTLQQTTTIDSVQIGSVFLDNAKIEGRRWSRMPFDPLTSGTHTIRVSWSNSADIRFKLFHVRPDSSDQVISAVKHESPAQWTGTLESTEQYYLGVWSASGSSYVTVTIETESARTNKLITDVTLDQGALDSEKLLAPRWERLEFVTDSTGEHIISVLWENSDADVLFKLRNANGTTASPTMRGANPGTWTGRLEANTAYQIGLWSPDGHTEYTATVRSIRDF